MYASLGWTPLEVLQHQVWIMCGRYDIVVLSMSRTAPDLLMSK